MATDVSLKAPAWHQHPHIPRQQPTSTFQHCEGWPPEGRFLVSLRRTFLFSARYCVLSMGLTVRLVGKQEKCPNSVSDGEGGDSRASLTHKEQFLPFFPLLLSRLLHNSSPLLFYFFGQVFLCAPTSQKLGLQALATMARQTRNFEISSCKASSRGNDNTCILPWWFFSHQPALWDTLQVLSTVEDLAGPWLQQEPSLKEEFIHCLFWDNGQKLKNRWNGW